MVYDRFKFKKCGKNLVQNTDQDIMYIDIDILVRSSKSTFHIKLDIPPLGAK